MFHKHKLSTFTISANEISGISFLCAIDIQTKEKVYFNRVDAVCPKHGKTIGETYSGPECRQCSFKPNVVNLPDIRHIIITLSECSTCSYYDIKIQDNHYLYSVNKEYIRLKIDDAKKKKTDSELDRLLNWNNPEYRNKEDELVLKNKVIDAQVKLISDLQHMLKDITYKYNESVKNDGIWEKLPDKVKKDLFRKYGSDLKIPPQVIIDSSLLKEIKC